MEHKYDTNHYKDEHATRITAAGVAGLTLIALIFSWEFPVFLLIGDFALRAFTRQSSPLSAIAATIASSASLEYKPIFAAPKKFAALLGFMFSVVILILMHYQLTTITYVIGCILSICALLEAAFNLCIGCYFYNWMVAPVINFIHSKKQ